MYYFIFDLLVYEDLDPTGPSLFEHHKIMNSLFEVHSPRVPPRATLPAEKKGLASIEVTRPDSDRFVGDF
jgi:hypothetical protein